MILSHPQLGIASGRSQTSKLFARALLETDDGGELAAVNHHGSICYSATQLKRQAIKVSHTRKKEEEKKVGRS